SGTVNPLHISSTTFVIEVTGSSMTSVTRATLITKLSEILQLPTVATPIPAAPYPHYLYPPYPPLHLPPTFSFYIPYALSGQYPFITPHPNYQYNSVHVS